jgi:hypothetical protein
MPLHLSQSATRADLRELELRMTVKLGSLIVAGTAFVAVLKPLCVEDRGGVTRFWLLVASKLRENQELTRASRLDLGRR